MTFNQTFKSENSDLVIEITPKSNIDISNPDLGLYVWTCGVHFINLSDKELRVTTSVLEVVELGGEKKTITYNDFACSIENISLKPGAEFDIDVGMLLSSPNALANGKLGYKLQSKAGKEERSLDYPQISFITSESGIAE